MERVFMKCKDIGGNLGENSCDGTKETISRFFLVTYDESAEAIASQVKQEITEEPDITPKNDNKLLREDVTSDIDNKSSICIEYQCSLCSYSTSSNTFLRQHEEQIHKTIDVAYKSNTSSSYQAIFEQHVRQKTIPTLNIKILKCDQCEYVTSLEDILFTHILKYHTVRRLRCTLCKYSTYDESLLNQHLLKHRMKYHTVCRLRCTLCKYSTYDESLLNQHLVKHRKKRKFQRKPIMNELSKDFACAECAFKTLDANCLKEHARSHKEPDNWVQCPYCPYKTSYKHGLRYHSRLHKEQIALEQKERKNGT